MHHILVLLQPVFTFFPDMLYEYPTGDRPSDAGKFFFSRGLNGFESGLNGFSRRERSPDAGKLFFSRGLNGLKCGLNGFSRRERSPDAGKTTGYYNVIIILNS